MELHPGRWAQMGWYRAADFVFRKRNQRRLVVLEQLRREVRLTTVFLVGGVFSRFVFPESGRREAPAPSR